MSDTNTHISVQSEIADLLERTAESKGVTVDRFLREMLLVYTAVELQQATADFQRVLRGERSSEETDTPEPDPACPYCRYSGTVNMVGSIEGFHICYCSNVYCPLDTYVEVSNSVQNEGVRLVGWLNE